MATTPDTIALQLPAYAADTLGETITLTVPNDPTWVARVTALAPRLAYGPNYSRAIIETLRDVSLYVSQGHLAGAETLMAYAEARNAR